MDLFERWPGSKYADHAKGNTELQRELQTIFTTKTCQEWLAFSEEHVTTIAPVNTPANIGDDPQFQHRMGFYPTNALGCEQLPLPAFVNGEPLPCPTKAPTVGEHTEEIMAEIGKSEADIAALRDSGAFG
jgi:crotonobetainyl-CoA:carnitine CoA-transferase CaiB-like acyl-CoA transferase